MKKTSRTNVGNMLQNNRLVALKSCDGTFVFEDISKANLLNDHFAQVCITDNNVIPDLQVLHSDTTLSTVIYRQPDVHKFLLKQKEKLSSGPDGLPPIFFKKLADSLCHPLTTMFNLFIQLGQIPLIWKQAIVTLIFKKGKSSSAENYRPISLTCVACKFFESILENKL